MARRRKATVAETVELVCEWLADKKIIACIAYRDDEGWQLSGTNYPALPGVLRAMADKAEEQMSDQSLN